MIAASVSAFTLIRIRAALAGRRRAATLRISLDRGASRRLNGATSSLRKLCGWPKPVR